jgi:hypothetical protein
MSNLEKLVAEIHTAIDSAQSLSNWLIQAELELVTWDIFPADMFEEILYFIMSKTFVTREWSWTLLHFLQNNYELLSSEQKARMVEALVKRYSVLEHWMAAFVSSEILGIYYADDDLGVSILRGIANIAPRSLGACIPHGLETIARATHSDVIRVNAVTELERLRDSSDEHVRDEADISIRKICSNK